MTLINLKYMFTKNKIISIGLFISAAVLAGIAYKQFNK